jgi:hypothetical protein
MARTPSSCRTFQGTFYGLGLGNGATGYKTEDGLKQFLATDYNNGLAAALARGDQVTSTRRATPSDMRWTVLGAPVLNGDRREAGPFVN